MDIRCSRNGTKCDGCPIMEECEKVELTEEVDLWKVYNQALEDFEKTLEKHQAEKWIDNLECRITFDDVEEVIKKLKK